MCKYQVFDGRHFIPYFYTKSVAVDMAKKTAARTGVPADIYKATKFGLVKDTTIQPS